VPQQRVRAVYLRGGTSRGLFFRREDLPDRREDWDTIFLAAMGSPDPNRRQLDGVGGGISSLSKVVIVERSTYRDLDVEYTFGQVAIDRAHVDYSNNCGNLTSAVGPFAVDEGLVAVGGESATLRLLNRNTDKRVLATFPLDGSEAAITGDLEIHGVAGSGAPIRLEFVDPEGALTGSLFPSGAAHEEIDVEGAGRVKVSMVDAAAAVVFVRPEAAGLRGDELPDQIETNAEAMAMLQSIRCAAALRMGLATSLDEAARSLNRPFVALVRAPQETTTLAGEVLRADQVDITARAVSMGQPHRALPLTVALCLAAAARIPDTVVHGAARPQPDPATDLRIGHPSGVFPVAADVTDGDDGWKVQHVVAYRTARRLMEGNVLVPGSMLPGGLVK
jgi:2-methylaconitate cis-trans-isomerase PrpF